jgi:Domain of unknown function (DUF305)
MYPGASHFKHFQKGDRIMIKICRTAVLSCAALSLAFLTGAAPIARAGHPGHLSQDCEQQPAASANGTAAHQQMAGSAHADAEKGRATMLTVSDPASSAMTISSAEAPFMAENQAAMDKMMAGMNVIPSGDVDHDFTAMMIPHHQGAIDMALAELRYGRNEQLRRIAQEIIVEQQEEIAAMKLALGQPLPPSVAAPTQGSPK